VASASARVGKPERSSWEAAGQPFSAARSTTACTAALLGNRRPVATRSIARFGNIEENTKKKRVSHKVTTPYSLTLPSSSAGSGSVVCGTHLPCHYCAHAQGRAHATPRHAHPNMPTQHTPTRICVMCEFNTGRRGTNTKAGKSGPGRRGESATSDQTTTSDQNAMRRPKRNQRPKRHKWSEGQETSCTVASPTDRSSPGQPQRDSDHPTLGIGVGFRADRRFQPLLLGVGRSLRGGSAAGLGVGVGSRLGVGCSSSLLGWVSGSVGQWVVGLVGQWIVVDWQVSWSVGRWWWVDCAPTVRGLVATWASGTLRLASTTSPAQHSPLTLFNGASTQDARLHRSTATA
jgi:hypothetical protein